LLIKKIITAIRILLRDKVIRLSGYCGQFSLKGCTATKTRYNSFAFLILC